MDKSTIPNNAGERIKILRQLDNMSQEELGRRIGVQRAAVQKYEKGTVENIPIKTIEKIANVFEVTPSYIMGWDKLNGNPMSIEVKIIQGLKHFYGRDSIDLMETYTTLNSVGRKKVLQYADDMSLIYGNINK